MSTLAPTLDSWIAAVARSDRPLWTRRPNNASRIRLAAYVLDMEAQYNRRFASYRDAHEWSVDSPAEFWRFVWSFTGVIGDPGAEIALDLDKMPGAEMPTTPGLNSPIDIT